MKCRKITFGTLRLCRSAHSSSLKPSQIHVLFSTFSIAIAIRLMISWINTTDLSPGMGLELIPRHIHPRQIKCRSQQLTQNPWCGRAINFKIALILTAEIRVEYCKKFVLWCGQWQKGDCPRGIQRLSNEKRSRQAEFRKFPLTLIERHSFDKYTLTTTRSRMRDKPTHCAFYQNTHMVSWQNCGSASTDSFSGQNFFRVTIVLLAPPSHTRHLDIRQPGTFRCRSTWYPAISFDVETKV